MKKNRFILILIAVMAAAYSFAVDATYVSGPGSIPWTATSAVSAGDVIVLNTNLFGVVKTDIASNEVGTVYVEGVYEMAKDGSVVTAIGDRVYWVPSGNPFGTTTGTGAASSSSSAGTNSCIGCAIETRAISNTTVRVMLQGWKQ